MRIAVLGPTHPYKGGIAQHTTELAIRLAAAGDQVRIISWSRQYPELLYPGQQRLDEPDMPLFDPVSYDLSWRNPLSWWSTGRRLVDEADGVILVLASPVQIPAYLVALAAANRTAARRGVPRPRTVVLAHNVLPHESRPGDRWLVRTLLTRAEGVLVHSAHEQEIARRLAPTPVRCRPLPPHLPGGVPERRQPADRPARRRVLFFGLVRPYKGLDILFRALAAVPSDLELLVTGEFWEPVARYQRLATELGIAGRVTLTPGYLPAPEVDGLLSGVDAMVLPYRSATGTQNVQLAFAHGLPVVVTDVGALPDQVRDGVNGFVVPPGDVQALASALRRLYEPGTLARLRESVLGADEQDDWPDYLAEITELLERERGGSRT